MRKETFIDAFWEAGFWATTDESTPQGGEPLDQNYGMRDLDPESRARGDALCDAFIAQFGDDFEAASISRGDAWAQAGHDFFLTCARHGCGFWDGGWGEPFATQATGACHAIGESAVSLYVGDDGRIYL